MWIFNTCKSKEIQKQIRSPPQAAICKLEEHTHACVCVRTRTRTHTIKMNTKGIEIFVLRFSERKRRFYENIDMNKITDNRIFWKTVKPLFSEKHILNKKITLVEKNDIVSNDMDVAEIMNLYFSFAIQDLEIDGYAENLCSSSVNSDPIYKIIVKFKDHPSILKNKERIIVKETFRLPTVNEKVISAEINSLNKSKPTSFNNIPIKLLMDTCDISSSYITTIYNNSITNSCYPSPLKWADITPVHKKDDRSLSLIIDLLAYSLLFQKSLNESFMIKF